MCIVAGVDGCKSGWVVVKLNTETREFGIQVVESFTEVFNLRADAIGVDMPIGLLDDPREKGRICDEKARKYVGVRHSTVQSAPTLRDIYRAPIDIWREEGEEYSISRSSGLIPKIIQVRESILSNCKLSDVVIEVHPEVSFKAAKHYLLTSDEDLQSKKNDAGLRERREILSAWDRTWSKADAELMRWLREHIDKGAALDDILDAAIACWTAERKLNNEAQHLPSDEPIQKDRHGLEMAIWY